LTAAVLALLVLALFGVVFFNRIGSHGIIKSVNCQVWLDSALTQNASVIGIDWGFLSPGTETNKTIYIQNTSNVPLNLTLATENWLPNATSNYMNLFWNYNGTLLTVGQVLPTILMLDVYSNITGITNFSFTIDIIGNG